MVLSYVSCYECLHHSSVISFNYVVYRYLISCLSPHIICSGSLRWRASVVEKMTTARSWSRRTRRCSAAPGSEMTKHVGDLSFVLRYNHTYIDKYIKQIMCMFIYIYIYNVLYIYMLIHSDIVII